VIGPPLQRRLLDAAKALFYPERRWETVLQAMPITARNRAQVNAFTRWLPTGRVAQKRADALALLHTLAAFRSSQPAPFKPRFEFEHTDAWEQVRRRITVIIDDRMSEIGTKPAVGICREKLSGVAFIPERTGRDA
jgi:hypothetical protein